MVKYQYLGIFEIIVWPIGNLIIPLNRAHRVVLATTMERLEQAHGQITGGIIRIGC